MTTTMTLLVRGSAFTDAGPVRSANEDSVALVLPEDAATLERRGVLAVLADGMGGHQGGALASRLAVETLTARYYGAAAELNPGQALRAAFAAANAKVFDTACSREGYAGMGTTCTAVAVVKGEARCAHAGDSRAYLLRAGAAYLLTEDHSLTRELVRDGLLTTAAARQHEDRNVLRRALGTQATVAADEWHPPFPLRASDRLLLCSDGLYEVFGDEELPELAGGDPAEACRRLVETAIARATGDNASAIVLALEGAAS